MPWLRLLQGVKFINIRELAAEAGRKKKNQKQELKQEQEPSESAAAPWSQAKVEGHGNDRTHRT